MELIEHSRAIDRPSEAPKQRSKAGRKPWMPPDLGQIEALAAKGLTYAQIADALGIHVHTLIRKRSQFEAFREALKRGRAKGIAAVANKLWEMAVQGHVVAAIFYLKCRAGWHEKRDFEAEMNAHAAAFEAREEQLRLLRAMTPAERQTIREITRRAEERLRGVPTRGDG